MPVKRDSYSVPRHLIPHMARSILGIAVAVLISNNAFAQAKIEQMIVTATKRSQDIQAVPASISAFSGEGLQERQVKTIQDLTGATPNVTFTSQSSTGVMGISVRGVSTDQIAMSGEQPIALHIDGIYQPRNTMLQLVMSDLEAVEILRGPQGTLYGRNATGGVINLVTKKPTDTFEASGTIFGGSYTRYGVRGYVSGPLSDKISVRVSGMIDRRDGWGDNPYLGTDVDASYAYGARAAIRLKPIDDVTVDLAVTRTFQNTTTPSYLTSPELGHAPRSTAGNYTPGFVGLVATAAAAGANLTHSAAPWVTYDEAIPHQTSAATSATGTINWDITPNVSLKSITGWQRTNFSYAMPYDTSPASLVATLVNRNFGNVTTSRTWSQEFNLNAKLWDRVDTVVGIYYLDDSIHNPGAVSIFPTISAAGPPLDALSSLLRQHTKSKAAFADFTVSITDELRLLAGIRRTLDYNDTIQAIQTTRLDTGAVIGGCGINHVVPPLDAHSTTGKLGLQYDITPEIMSYVTWQNGFKAGGYNFSVCDNAFKPEHIYSWEVGVKSTLFDGSTTLNVALFDYRYANIQVSRTVPADPSVGRLVASTVIDNAASAKIRGADIELNTYLTDNLKVDVGVGLLHSEYGTLVAVNPSILGNPVVNVAGNQLARAPNLTFNAGIEYTMRIGDFGELKSRAEYKYSSRIWYSAFDEDFVHQDGYSVWNAIFTFTPDSCPDLQFQAYVRNIADKGYRIGAFPSATTWHARGNWGAPRTIGGEITAKF